MDPPQGLAATHLLAEELQRGVETPAEGNKQRGTLLGHSKVAGPLCQRGARGRLNADSGERATPEPHQTGRVTPRFLISAPQYVLILLLANEPHVYTLGDLS